MKVLFYSGVFARIGGIEEFTKDLAIALHEAGISVRIICSSLQNPILTELKDSGVKITRIPIFHGCCWNIPDYFLLLPALIKMRTADVVIHQKPFVPWFYSLMSCRPRHVYITAYRPAEQFPNLGCRGRFFSFFDAILTQADLFRRDLHEASVDAAIDVCPYLPPAIPATLPEAGCRSDGILKIGMMGRLETQKNPMYALQVVHELKRKPPVGCCDVEFHVYGTGSLKAAMEDRSANLGLKTIFHGRYVRSQVPEIVAGSDLFLITSVSEGQCIVALEVLAQGRPLFATPIGALPEILEQPERGTLIPESDAEASAACIRDWLLLNGDFSPEDIQKSYLRDYDVDQVKGRYVDLIKRYEQR